jgi:hypothetical protein
MKNNKTIIFCLAFAVWQSGFSQNSVSAVGGYGSNRIICGELGSQPCIGNVSVNHNKSESNTSSINIAKDASGHLVFQFLKSQMTKEQEEITFKDKFVYFVEQDIILDDSINDAFERTKEQPIIIRQGMYPIIEWLDSYFVKF